MSGDGNVSPMCVEPSSSGKKGKKKEDEGPAEIVISTVARTKKKNVTHITGLARFGIKLVDAQKIFAKKFAAAASVTQDKDEVVIQGDCAITLSELLIKQWPVRPICFLCIAPFPYTSLSWKILTLPITPFSFSSIL